MSQSGFVQTTTNEGIATIVFFHPAHNSMPSHLLAQLEAAIDTVAKNEAVNVVVLKSEGDRTFCAGASFDELAAIADYESGKAFFMGFARVINAMRRCPKPIIGRIQGKAIGGGVGLAAATDYCIASHFATFRLSELAIGIGPFVIGPAVERKMGKSAFQQLALTPSDWQTAEWAKEKGLYNDVFPDIKQVDAYVDHLAKTLNSYHPDALRQLKKVFWEGTENWDTLLEARAEISGSLVLSDFTRNAIQAFKQKTA